MPEYDELATYYPNQSETMSREREERGEFANGVILAYRRENGSDGLMARLPGETRLEGG
jgi:hypothetical protein